MLMKMRRLMKGGEKGQGMTEYIIIVCLVAIACLGAVGTFGDQLIKLFGDVTEKIGGTRNDTNMSPIRVQTNQSSPAISPGTPS